MPTYWVVIPTKNGSLRIGFPLFWIPWRWIYSLSMPLSLFLGVYLLRRRGYICPTILYKHKKKIRGLTLQCKLWDRQVNYPIFRNMNLEKEKLERENQHFPSWVHFFLPFIENGGHIYRRKWFDLSLNYFDDKCYYSYDIWRHLSFCARVDWHMNMLVYKLQKEAF